MISDRFADSQSMHLAQAGRAVLCELGMPLDGLAERVDLLARRRVRAEGAHKFGHRGLDRPDRLGPAVQEGLDHGRLAVVRERRRTSGDAH